jgi:hypothetical protein
MPAQRNLAEQMDSHIRSQFNVIQGEVSGNIGKCANRESATKVGPSRPLFMRAKVINTCTPHPFIIITRGTDKYIHTINVS